MPLSVKVLSTSPVSTQVLEIHYTTDGSVPTLQSPKYDGPVKVTETTDFTFRTFRPNGKPGDITTTRFIKSEYTPAVTAAPSIPD